MSKTLNRRTFFKTGAIATVAGATIGIGCDSSSQKAGILPGGFSESHPMKDGNYSRNFNQSYAGPFLSRIAFPLGGMGAGMVCIEGSGCISHVSVRNTPDVFNEPFMMGAFSIKGAPSLARVLEGPVPHHKIFGKPRAGNGSSETSYGFPRFAESIFTSNFPFARVALKDEKIPVEVMINVWSPFIPGDEDNSSLPVACLEYEFKNTSQKPIEGVFSYHAMNFMRIERPSEFGGNYERGGHIQQMKNGFMLSQKCHSKKPHFKGDFGIFTSAKDVVVDHSLFRGGWFDARSIIWKDVENGNMPSDGVKENTTGASLYVPVELQPGASKVIPLMFAWYVPHSNIRRGPSDEQFSKVSAECEKGNSECCSPEYSAMFYEPWYSGKFQDVHQVAEYWNKNYNSLKIRSKQFSESFYAQTLPDEVLESVAANLTILKSPTVLRQKGGSLWAWEGCHDLGGCCHGSCTHVWNYAQAIPHLFPRLERTLRETEFHENQDEKGHQTFRSALPVRENDHGFHAAADGQLGGIMKIHREWRISGDTDWLKSLWPKVRKSMDYCIKTWDPKEKGVLEEPHHNTYDIEFWGPDGMCASFYLGALYAMSKMGKALNDDISCYEQLYKKGKAILESELYDGEYFIQKIQWEGLVTPSPVEKQEENWNINYSEEARELLIKEGPKYQYGTGCLSDGILGAWIGSMSGLDDFIDKDKVKSHLKSIHKYNLKTNLSNHVNPQRPSFALGNEGGLLLCTWPKGGALTLPFVYSNEVWTGIEYQVASHLMLMGEVQAGLDIVREVRKRYDGRIRNPFNEYECGHWYARALASYGLLQGLTGIRYDAVDQTLYIDSKIGNDFQCFLATEKGYGLAGLKNSRPFLNVVEGDISVKKCMVSGDITELNQHS
jgi:uncharacterized protein (DUF608 family)